MIIEYHRPRTIDEALALLARSEPVSRPLAGGTGIDRSAPQPVAVVDLQALGLDSLSWRGGSLELGAMVTLQDIIESDVPEELKSIARLEASYNLRQSASVAGTLVAADGRSAFTTTLLALDTALTVVSLFQSQFKEEQIGLGDLLPLRGERLAGKLISSLRLPGRGVRLAYEYIARTPADLPLVCAAATAWPSGRTRLALGGYGAAPTLAFDGSEAQGAEIAARSAYSAAGDEWASAEYRTEMAGILAERCLARLAP